MTFSSHHLFRFVSLLFAISLRVNAVPKPSDLITDICSQTIDDNLCYQVLSPRGKPAASDLRGLAQVALTPTKSSVQYAYNLVSRLQKDAKDPKLKKPLDLCLGNYKDAVSNLNVWEKFLISSSYANLQTTAISVSAQPVYCDQNFAVPVTEPSELKAASSKLQGLCSIIQVISSSLAGN